jgi:hypothetical protein
MRSSCCSYKFERESPRAKQPFRLAMFSWHDGCPACLNLPVRMMKSLFVALLVLTIPMAMGASVAPQRACGSALAPAYPPPGEPPIVPVWHDKDLRRSGWEPPHCAGWAPSSPSKLVLAMAGSFRFDGTVDELVARIGAISTLRGVRFWSVTEKTWRPFVVDASALSGFDPRGRRPDFLVTEMTAGSELYYWEKQARSGSIVYRMTVLERSPARTVVATENLSPVRFLFLTLFAPGAIQSVTCVERISPGVWGAYILVRTGAGASALASGHDASYVNRAVAIYRHLAGIPTDEEPPAAP